MVSGHLYCLTTRHHRHCVVYRTRPLTQVNPVVLWPRSDGMAMFSYRSQSKRDYPTCDRIFKCNLTYKTRKINSLCGRKNSHKSQFDRYNTSYSIIKTISSFIHNHWLDLRNNNNINTRKSLQNLIGFKQVIRLSINASSK